MNTSKLHLSQILILGIIGLVTAAIIPYCTAHVSLKIVTSQNTTGHRTIQTDLAMPQANTTADKTNFEINQYDTVIDGVKLTHLSSLISVNGVPSGYEPSGYELGTRSVPSGYELVSRVGWYRFHKEVSTWQGAKCLCEKEGGHLAVINSQEESDALADIYNRHGNKVTGGSYDDKAFIGFGDEIEGKYLTIFGQTLEEAGFAIWESYQPNNLRGQDCGAMERNGKLNDLECDAKQPFICEYPL